MLLCLVGGGSICLLALPCGRGNDRRSLARLPCADTLWAVEQLAGRAGGVPVSQAASTKRPSVSWRGRAWSIVILSLTRAVFVGEVSRLGVLISRNNEARKRDRRSVLPSESKLVFETTRGETCEKSVAGPSHAPSSSSCHERHPLHAQVARHQPGLTSLVDLNSQIAAGPPPLSGPLVKTYFKTLITIVILRAHIPKRSALSLLQLSCATYPPGSAQRGKGGGEGTNRSPLGPPTQLPPGPTPCPSSHVPGPVSIAMR